MDKEKSVESFEQFALFLYRLWVRLRTCNVVALVIKPVAFFTSLLRSV